MGHRGRGSVQSGDDSSGEEQLHSLISLRLSTMSDHPCPFANIILAQLTLCKYYLSFQILSLLSNIIFAKLTKIGRGRMREFFTFSDGGRGFQLSASLLSQQCLITLCIYYLHQIERGGIVCTFSDGRWGFQLSGVLSSQMIFQWLWR